MKILFLNNDGGGFADHIDIPPDTTLAALFASKVPHGQPADYLIRVNRQPAPSDYRLQEGDRVSLTPTKIQGAVQLVAQVVGTAGSPGHPGGRPAHVVVI